MRTTSTGRKLIWFLCVLIYILVLLVIGRYYARIDLTQGKKFSVSDYTKELLADLQEPLRITYYVSSELTKLYPQTHSIKDFLLAFASVNPLISLDTVDPVSEGLEDSLSRLGVFGQQIQSAKGNTTEYTTVYSAIMIEYLELVTVIPFILSDEMLEFELTSRLMHLVEGISRPVFIMAGNGMDVEKDYSYVIPWLQAAGFVCNVISPQEFSLMQATEYKHEYKKTPLVVFGTSKFTTEQAQFVREYVESGGNALIMSSAITVDIYNGWEAVPAEKDAVLSLLDEWGIDIRNDILNDISCFNITLYSDESTPRYETMNYPMWIASLPQYTSSNPITNKLTGIHFFWASPIDVLAEQAETLVYTSPAAWCTEPDFSHSPVYVTNPFIIPKTASQTGKSGLQFSLAVKKQIEDGGTVIFVGDQYFASTILMDYTGSFSNLNFLVNSLLSLSGNEELLDIRNRVALPVNLHKKDFSQLIEDKNKILFFTCFMFPVLPGIIAFLVLFIRKIKSIAAAPAQKEKEKN